MLYAVTFKAYRYRRGYGWLYIVSANSASEAKRRGRAALNAGIRRPDSPFRRTRIHMTGAFPYKEENV